VAPLPTPSATPTTALHPAPSPKAKVQRSSVNATVLPAFTSSVSTVTAADLPHSWHSGCPVSPSQLRAVHLTFYGFDRRAHHGALIVNASVTSTVRAIFRELYAHRFPIRRMIPVDAYGGDDNASMAADNTSAFNCRAAVANGPKRWSVHAFGKAIDVNT